MLFLRFTPSLSLIKHLQFTNSRWGSKSCSISRLSQSTSTSTRSSSSSPSYSSQLESYQENEQDQTYTTLSFYKFANPKLTNVESIVNTANEKLYNQFYDKLKGTLIFAEEGVNAQITVNTKYLQSLQKCINNDIHPFLNNIQFNIGETRIFANQLPFKRLIVRSKKQILTDGITFPTSTTTATSDPSHSSDSSGINDNSTAGSSSAKRLVIEWNEETAGPELSGEEWHKEVSHMLINNNNNHDNNDNHNNNNDEKTTKTILLDCRNEYESDMGTFENAIPLNTTKFSDSWPVLDTLLENVPKDTRILTFCTGGIRCVKVNAFLRQKLNFENTARLQDGIIGYERWFENQQQQSSEQQQTINDCATDKVGDLSDGMITTMSTKAEVVEDVAASVAVKSVPSSSSSSSSLFKGTNFVFDRRRLIDGASPSS